MDMWEWRAGERCSGVSGDADRAIQAAERQLAMGENARVERVRAFLGFRTMSSYYVRTGEGWIATRTGRGRIAWQSFPLSRRRTSGGDVAGSVPGPGPGLL
jgi:hypothetical protein